MVMKKLKSVRKSKPVKKTGSGSGKMNHLVVVNVRNGPFKTASQAEQTRSILASKGIRTSEVKKAKGGYIFTSSVSYATPTVALKNKVVSTLHRHVDASGLPKAAVTIKSRHI